MPIIDLHIHSYYSDGEYSPLQIRKFATENDLSLFSVTDHNTLSEEVVRISVEADEQRSFLPGVEISSVDRKRELSLHVLGYSFAFDEVFLNAQLEETVHGYNRRARKIVEKLNKEFSGLVLDYEEMLYKTPARYVSRNTLAAELSRFLEEDIKSVLKKYVWIDENDSWMFSTKEAIKVITDAGGIPVLAHSGRVYEKLGDKEYRNLAKELVGEGLRGIEVCYPSHSKAVEQGLRHVTRDYKLVVTGGSDWHGDSLTPDIALGVTCPKKEVEKFREVLNGK